MTSWKSVARSIRVSEIVAMVRVRRSDNTPLALRHGSFGICQWHLRFMLAKTKNGVLSLSNNKIGPQGAKVLAAALPSTEIQVLQ